MNHSPEPWFPECNALGNLVGRDPCGFSGEFQQDIAIVQNPEDARRIVACVNFCKGIPLDVLLSRAADKPTSTGSSPNGVTAYSCHVPLDSVLFPNGKEKP